MKVTYLKDDQAEELEIVVHYREDNEDLLHFKQVIGLLEEKILVKHDATSYLLPVSMIYYCEAVDNTVFCNTKERTYETSYRLYELESSWLHRGFVRTGKSTLVNLRRIASFRPVLSGRIEATMMNGEKTMISRVYAKTVRQALMTLGGHQDDKH
ncbi:MAG: LytTR family transcriptional regulator [Acholeplasmatales bacterium]|nr:MAG: LytTR family transcriptional regulator [Acholeplasmatales bacterium]